MSIQRPRKHEAEFSKIIKLTESVYWLKFRIIGSGRFNFTAGQRCLFNVGIKNNNYSLCSSPSQHEEIETCVDTVPLGPGSRWVRERKAGDRFELIGPLGTFKVSGNGGTKVFLATGIGIAPIRSMIFNLLENNYKEPVYLYWGLRNSQSVYWQKDFERLKVDYPNFHFLLALSQSDSFWEGKKGYVQLHLLNDLNKLKHQHTEFYLCGNGEMIRETCKMLSKKGISKEKIFFEKFFEVRNSTLVTDANK